MRRAEEALNQILVNFSAKNTDEFRIRILFLISYDSMEDINRPLQLWKEQRSIKCFPEWQGGYMWFKQAPDNRKGPLTAPEKCFDRKEVCWTEFCSSDSRYASGCGSRFIMSDTSSSFVAFHTFTDIQIKSFISNFFMLQKRSVILILHR